MQKRKIGLALGSGAVRGLAHIGVLEVLETEGIPIDMIAGTSTGAAIGALYAQGKSASVIKSTALDLSWRRLASMIDLTLPKGTKIKWDDRTVVREELEKLKSVDLSYRRS